MQKLPLRDRPITHQKREEENRKQRKNEWFLSWGSNLPLSFKFLFPNMNLDHTQSWEIELVCSSIETGSWDTLKKRLSSSLDVQIRTSSSKSYRPKTKSRHQRLPNAHLIADRSFGWLYPLEDAGRPVTFRGGKCPSFGEKWCSDAVS